MAFLFSVTGEPDDWMITNRGASVLVDLLRRSGMDGKLVQAFEVATYFNGIEIDMQTPDDVELSKSILAALNSLELDEVDADLAERYQELRRLLAQALDAHPENGAG